MKTKQKAVIFVVLLAVIAFGLFGYKYLPTSSLSTVSGSSDTCMDWMVIPDIQSCSSESDCLTSLTGGAPLDSGAELRCSSGVCQARITDCDGVVLS